MGPRIAVITGAGRGLGRAIAWALAEAGAVVGVNDIDAEAAHGTASQLTTEGYDAFAVPGDVGDAAAVDRIFAEVANSGGRLDWLVNNAAVYIRQSEPFWKTSVDDWDRVVRASLTSVFLCSKAAAPVMAAQGYGRIVNIASQAALGYVPWQGPHYHAAKAGVVHLTRAMAVDLAPFGVTVNAVAPTAVLTPESRQRFDRDPRARQRVEACIPMGRFAEPHEVAGVVAFVLSDEAGYITGETLPVRGGLSSYGIRRVPDA